MVGPQLLKLMMCLPAQKQTFKLKSEGLLLAVPGSSSEHKKQDPAVRVILESRR
jgi:hypothetical protein